MRFFMNKSSILIMSLLMLSGLTACSGSSSQNESVNTGPAQDAEDEQPGQNNKNADNDKKSDLDVAAMIASMSWKPYLYNNQTGKIYTGYDGQNEFKVVLDLGVYGELPSEDGLSEDDFDAIYGSDLYLEALEEKGAKLSVEVDAALLSSELVEEYPGGRLYLLTTVAAGDSSIKASFEGENLDIEVSIAQYTPAQVAAGSERYNNDVTDNVPTRSCASCHQSENGIDHSPFFMAQFSDAGILSTIETGVNSDDDYNTSIPHQWGFDNDDQKNGIVAYLRSLDPLLEE